MAHISDLVDGTRIAVHTCCFLSRLIFMSSITSILPHLEGLGDIINVLDTEQVKSLGYFWHMI